MIQNDNTEHETYRIHAGLHTCMGSNHNSCDPLTYNLKVVYASNPGYAIWPPSYIAQDTSTEDSCFTLAVAQNDETDYEYHIDIQVWIVSNSYPAYREYPISIVKGNPPEIEVEVSWAFPNGASHQYILQRDIPLEIYFEIQLSPDEEIEPYFNVYQPSSLHSDTDH